MGSKGEALGGGAGGGASCQGAGHGPGRFRRVVNTALRSYSHNHFANDNSEVWRLEHQESQTDELDLPPVLDLAAARTLCQSLRECLLRGNAIVVGGGQVERVSTHGVQVLLAAASDARAQGLALHLHDPSPALAEALADLGLRTDLFG